MITELMMNDLSNAHGSFPLNGTKLKPIFPNQVKITVKTKE